MPRHCSVPNKQNKPQPSPVLTSPLTLISLFMRSTWKLALSQQCRQLATVQSSGLPNVRSGACSDILRWLLVHSHTLTLCSLSHSARTCYENRIRSAQLLLIQSACRHICNRKRSLTRADRYVRGYTQLPFFCKLLGWKNPVSATAQSEEEANRSTVADGKKGKAQVKLWIWREFRSKAAWKKHSDKRGYKRQEWSESFRNRWSDRLEKKKGERCSENESICLCWSVWHSSHCPVYVGSSFSSESLSYSNMSYIVFCMLLLHFLQLPSASSHCLWFQPGRPSVTAEQNFRREESFWIQTWIQAFPLFFPAQVKVSRWRIRFPELLNCFYSDLRKQSKSISFCKMPTADQHVHFSALLLNSPINLMQHQLMNYGKNTHAS